MVNDQNIWWWVLGYIVVWALTSAVIYYVIDRDGDRLSAVAGGFCWPATWMLGAIVGMGILGGSFFALIANAWEYVAEAIKGRS